jgi:UDP-2,3-diacylglucosamine pyrophosphatase LpxH
MPELQSDTLIVFVSDSHIGGDPGCDGFESSEELEALFDELAGHDGPVELILAGDFFDFLQIGKVPEGGNRASLTIERPEYEQLFAALKHNYRHTPPAKDQISNRAVISDLTRTDDF